ncbi:MAG: hypothetical protein CMQ88_04160 [Gammaproteobacteria bacterium]|nr:hypothetical protein [Gammaproteobacteria bacterium]|tara:strand:+ start:1982 stop:2470 length:489 start_codon:yes stop_codon:yes gene_type:complete
MSENTVKKLETPAKKSVTKSFDEAMLAFQMLSVGAVKRGKNPHFRSTYATLESVIEAASQANQFGLYFTQPLDLIQLGDQIVQVVKTIVVHAPTGEQRTSLCPVRSKDNQDPQKMGSGITYAKRYALQSAFGLPSEDDDGNKAAEPTPQNINNKPAAQPKEF